MRYDDFWEAWRSIPVVLDTKYMIQCYTDGHYEIVKIEEKPGREAIVTDSDRAADQMVKDIFGDKIDRAGRQTVRRALDSKDAPPTGRAATDGALGRISRRGGF